MTQAGDTFARYWKLIQAELAQPMPDAGKMREWRRLANAAHAEMKAAHEKRMIRLMPKGGKK